MPINNPPPIKFEMVMNELPPPSEELYREGRLVRIPGSPDRVYMLVKQADGSLVWVQIATPAVT